VVVAWIKLLVSVANRVLLFCLVAGFLMVCVAAMVLLARLKWLNVHKKRFSALGKPKLSMKEFSLNGLRCVDPFLFFQLGFFSGFVYGCLVVVDFG